MDAETKTRLTRYAKEYAGSVWGETVNLTDEDIDIIEIRSDGYANAHVEGEHEALGLCHADSARECGERMAASEWVECN